MAKPAEPAGRPQIVDGRIAFAGRLFEVPNVVLDAIMGAGANGVIFAGRDTLLERPVIAKLYVPKEGDRRDKREQAIQEGRKLARLRHPNIVQIFAAYPHDAGVLLVMERLDGPSLKDYLAQPRGLDERIRLWDDISEGLKYAHAQGVLHGDLHWKNVVVQESRAILIDFGTSIFQKQGGQSREREVNMPWELLGRLFGEDGLCAPSQSHLAGMSPEDSLFGCEQAVELIKVQREVVRVFKTDDDYYQRGYLFKLATIVSEFPFFPADVLDWVEKNVPVDYQFHFYDHLKAYLGRRRANETAVLVEYSPEEPIPLKRSRAVADMGSLAKVLLDEKRIR